MEKLWQKVNNYMTKRMVLLFIIFSLINLIAVIPAENLITDIFSHFLLQFFVINILFAVLFIFFSFKNKKFIILLILSFLLCGLNFALIYSAKNNEDSQQLQTSDIKNISLGVINVLTSNNKYSELMQIIRNENPDILILQETDDIWLSNIEDIKKIYPYRIEHTRFDNFGMALYSKIPLINPAVVKWTELEVPIIKTQIKPGNEIYTIYAIHTLPPTSRDYLAKRNEMLANITKITATKKNIIIAGDLNTTIYSRAYRKNISGAGLKDSQAETSTLSGTWNSRHLPFFRISLEHVLTSQNIKTTSFRLGKFFGSDHFPIFVNIELK